MTLLGELARDRLRQAARPIPVVRDQEPTTEPVTVPPPSRATPKPKRPAASTQNGHQSPDLPSDTVPVRWSLNQRLQELGYP